MKITNYEVPRLAELLFNLKLKGKDSRMRTRLINKLNDYIKDTLNREEYELLLEYGLKDANNKFVVNHDGGYALIPEKANEYYIEMNTLQNESFVIDESESNKEMLLSVAHSIINCDLELDSEMAMLWDKWCGQFEEFIDKNKSVD